MLCSATNGGAENGGGIIGGEVKNCALDKELVGCGNRCVKFIASTFVGLRPFGLLELIDLALILACKRKTCNIIIVTCGN
jgi:hypothetical protein